MLQQILFTRGTARHCEWTPSQNQTPRAQPDGDRMRAKQSQSITYCVVIAVVCVGQQSQKVGIKMFYIQIKSHDLW